MPRSWAIHRYDLPSSMACNTFGASLSDLGRCPGCRPSFLPRARAAARPDFTRSLRRSRSNWAIPASMVAIIRPWGVSSSKVSDKTNETVAIPRLGPCAAQRTSLECHPAPYRNPPLSSRVCRSGSRSKDLSATFQSHLRWSCTASSGDLSVMPQATWGMSGTTLPSGKNAATSWPDPPSFGRWRYRRHGPVQGKIVPRAESCDIDVRRHATWGMSAKKD